MNVGVWRKHLFGKRHKKLSKISNFILIYKRYKHNVFFFSISLVQEINLLQKDQAGDAQFKILWLSLIVFKILGKFYIFLCILLNVHFRWGGGWRRYIWSEQNFEIHRKFQTWSQMWDVWLIGSKKWAAGSFIH